MPEFRYSGEGNINPQMWYEAVSPPNNVDNERVTMAMVNNIVYIHKKANLPTVTRTVKYPSHNAGSAKQNMETVLKRIASTIKLV